MGRQVAGQILPVSTQNMVVEAVAASKQGAVQYLAEAVALVVVGMPLGLGVAMRLEVVKQVPSQPLLARAVGMDVATGVVVIMVAVAHGMARLEALQVAAVLAELGMITPKRVQAAQAQTAQSEFTHGR